ncbi:MAG TPA: Mut7-C RNAse domain-containing protein [Candidatus Tectomicrobia bacterium]|nr:Mut7-C RNAse domain-containing protein [Candidatus Tectomicrobia bacterium]
MENEVRFIADAMLGKLTKWLRVLGLDVVYDPNTTDAELLQWAERGGKILLTRDRRLMRRRGPLQCLYVESDYYPEQVRQVVQAFDLADRIRLFTRCIRCNEPLRAITKHDVVEKVPPYVYATQPTFKHCARCDRLYWGGTHRDNMLQQLQAMLAGLL